MELKISSNFMEITSSDLSNTNAGGIAIVGSIITVVAGIALLLYEQVGFCF